MRPLNAAAERALAQNAVSHGDSPPIPLPAASSPSPDKEPLANHVRRCFFFKVLFDLGCTFSGREGWEEVRIWRGANASTVILKQQKKSQIIPLRGFRARGIAFRRDLGLLVVLRDWEMRGYTFSWLFVRVDSSKSSFMTDFLQW